MSEIEDSLISYERYRHAGEVPLEEWARRGIKMPVLDKDGTITDANQDSFVAEVIEGLNQQGLPEIFEGIAVVSNNPDANQVKDFGDRLQDELGINVFCVWRSKGRGFPRKPHPAMGLHVADEFGLLPHELGVIGDRRLVDVPFGLNLGAGAIALCRKAGEGDARGVPVIRPIEALMVAVETIAKRAAPLPDTKTA